MPTSLTGKAFVLSLGSLLQKASTFIVVLFLVRLLDKDMYGTYQQLLYVGGIVYGLFAAGLAASVYYFLPRLEPDKRGQFAIQTILVMAVLGIASALVMWGFSGHIAHYVKNPALEPTLRLYAFYVFFWIASDYFRPFMNASGRYVQSIIFAIFESALNAISLLAPLIWGEQLNSALVWLAVAGGIRYLVYVVVTLRVANVVSSTGRFNTREQLHYSFPLMASGWGDLLGNYLDKVVVSLLYSPAMVAIYAVGTLKIPFWDVLVKPVNIVLRVKFAELLRTDRRSEIDPIWREAVRKQSMIVLPIVFFLWVAAGHLIPLLFTESYSESISVLRIYLLDKPLLIMSFSVFPLSMGRPDIILKGSLAFLIANIVLMTVLASVLGIYGPILSMVVAKYVETGFYVYTIWRYLLIRPTDLFPLAILVRVFGAALAAAIVSYVICRIVESHLAALGLSAAVYAGIYLTILRVQSVLRDDDLNMLRRKLWPA